MSDTPRHGRLSRRQFGGVVLGACPAAVLGSALGSPALARAAQGRPDSVFGGIPIGVIAPFSFGQEAPDAKAVLRTLVSLGISSVELQNSAVEAFAGAPAGGRGGRDGGRAGAGRGSPPDGSARGDAQGTRGGQATDALREWRVNVPMDRFRALRQMYADAGVRIAAYRITLAATMPEAEYDHAFNAARALGANQVTMELPDGDDDLTRRIGTAAGRHGVYVGYHNHLQPAHAWDTALAQSPHNGIQLDIGHFVANNSESPIAFIERHRNRIVSMHLKDRMRGAAGGTQVPMGEGHTPLIEAFRAWREHQLETEGIIELSYPIPEGSTRTAEVARCLEYCRRAILG